MDINGDYLMAPVTDHELSHSASDQSINSSEKSHHHITNGYEICVHICVKGGCISRKTQTILWYKEGHVVCKHAGNTTKHLLCTEDCPGGSLLGRETSSPAGGRNATDKEVSSYMGKEAEDDAEDDHSPTTATQLFKIIYIPDAAMRIVSKEKALNDLGFIPTSLSESEYEPLQHLMGSIHILSKGKAKHSNDIILKVIMQEWVSVLH
jgi:hypothetical protein